MKRNEAEYVVPLRNVFNSPKGKRARRAIKEIKKFVWKHARAKNTRITTDVNKKITVTANHIPRKIEVILVKEKDRVSVYLKGSKQLEQEKAKAVEKESARKAREESKKAREAVGGGKKEEAVEDAEQKRKLEEKRKKEKAAVALEHKRG